MDLKEILAVSGKPGLYKIISQTRNGVIVVYAWYNLLLKNDLMKFDEEEAKEETPAEEAIEKPVEEKKPAAKAVKTEKKEKKAPAPKKETK